MKHFACSAPRLAALRRRAAWPAAATIRGRRIGNGPADNIDGVWTGTYIAD